MRTMIFILLCGLLIAPMAIAEDWSMWGRTVERNMVSPAAVTIPLDLAPGERTEAGTIDPATQNHVRWTAKLGSQAYGNVTVANGHALLGTNNAAPRDPASKGDRSVVIAFAEKGGDFLWQLAIPKLGAGKVSDWEFLGICSSPQIEGDRAYVVTNRCEVIAIDLKGMANGNQGFQDEAKYLGVPETTEITGDILWKFDMRDEVGVFPHNITSSSVLIVGDHLYVTTSNGVDWTHTNIPNPQAPALIRLNKNNGKLTGEEGAGISKTMLHANWSSPAYAVFDGKPTVVFGDASGYLWGFGHETKKKDEGYDILQTRWQVDVNPPEYRKDAEGQPIKYAEYQGPSEIIATPVIHEGLIYITIGQDPEHGEGVGALTCVDPTKPDGEQIVWQYKKIMRSISTVSVADGLVYAADFSGKIHCLDAKTGAVKWVHATGSHIWGSTLVVDGKVLIGDESGKLTILEAGPEKKVLREIDFGAPIYSSPVVANQTLYIATQDWLWAFALEGK